MTKTFAQLFSEADAFFEKKAVEEVKTASESSFEDDEIMSLVSDLRNMGVDKTAQAKKAVEEYLNYGEKVAEAQVEAQVEPEPFEFTEAEKVAYALAVAETISGGDELNKLAGFEKKALDLGHNPSEVEHLLNKYASSKGGMDVAGCRVLHFLSTAKGE